MSSADTMIVRLPCGDTLNFELPGVRKESVRYLLEAMRLAAERNGLPSPVIVRKSEVDVTREYGLPA